MDMQVLSLKSSLEILMLELSHLQTRKESLKFLKTYRSQVRRLKYKQENLAISVLSQ